MNLNEIQRLNNVTNIETEVIEGIQPTLFGSSLYISSAGINKYGFPPGTVFEHQNGYYMVIGYGGSNWNGIYLSELTKPSDCVNLNDLQQYANSANKIYLPNYSLPNNCHPPTEKKYCAPHLEYLLDQTIETGADINILFDDGSSPPIKAHQCILVSRSEWFRKILTSGMKEAQEKTITLPGNFAPYFMPILKFIYTGIISLDDGSPFIQYFEIVDYLCITDLLEEISNYFEVNPANLLELLDLSSKVCLKKLEEKIKKYLESKLQIISNENPELFNTLFENHLEIVLPIIQKSYSTTSNKK